MKLHPATPLPKSFSTLAGANLAAQSAEQVSLAAVPIAAMLALGAGPGEIGALATAQTLPFLLLSIPLGLLADRSSRRRLMVISELVRGAALVALLIAAVALLLRLPEPARAAAARPPRHPWIELKEGAGLVWQNPLLRPILVTAAAWNLAWFVLQAAYVPHAVQTLGLSTGGVGATLASYGIGW